MGFVTAVRTSLSRYARFSGRARRSEYWWFVVFIVLVSVLALIIDVAIGTDDVYNRTGLVELLVTLALVLPGLSVTVRRLHDINCSGWWVLAGVIPVVGYVLLIVWGCIDSKPDNRFGPSPKVPAAALPPYQQSPTV